MWRFVSQLEKKFLNGVCQIFFDGLSFLSQWIRYKMDNLLGDEYYSSKKLERLRFRPEKSLRDIGA